MKGLEAQFQLGLNTANGGSMAQQVRERVLVKALREIASERGIRFTSFSYDWIVRLELDGKIRYVHGYNFDLNNASAALIAGDKSAVASLLKWNEIAHVEHEFFLHPSLSGFVGTEGNWERAVEYASRHDFQVVCKPNVGTGGNRVYRVRNRRELEEAFHRLFQWERGICISPYYPIEDEFRLILLCGECVLSYVKRLPEIVGDGQSTVGALLFQATDEGKVRPSVAVRTLDEMRISPAAVLRPGETVKVNWKHNLGQGSIPQPIRDLRFASSLLGLAVEGAGACNISFASVDIIKTRAEYRILEVNSGVMMERYAKLAPEGYQEAKRVYGKAVGLMFAD